MGSITAAAEALVAQLNAALEAAELRTRATTDPAKARTAALSRCGLLVGPPAYEWGGTLAGGADVVWTLTVVARAQPGVRDAWDAIDEVITAVQDAVDLATARPGSSANPEGGDPLPAYVLTTQPTTV